MGVLEDLQKEISELKTLTLQVVKNQTEIQERLPYKVERELNLKEILLELKLKSYTAFYNRLSELQKYGLYKENGWRMRFSDLQQYKNSLQNKR